MSLLIANPPNQTNGIEKKTPKYYLNKKRRLLEPLEEVDGYFRKPVGKPEVVDAGIPSTTGICASNCSDKLANVIGSGWVMF
jgi:hypothetical protein